MASEPRFRFFTHPVTDEELAKLPDGTVVKENTVGGRLVRIERRLRPPVPRKAEQ